MANIFNVARYILEKQGSLSTWKLQKLCYYSQAWSLAWTGEPLFSEDFQAWANGPVCPSLFDKHRGKFIVSLKDFPQSLESPPALSEDEIDTIDRVLNHYGNMEPYQLREQSHSESPWIDARDGLPDGASSNATITKESIGEFYGGL